MPKYSVRLILLLLILLIIALSIINQAVLYATNTIMDIILIIGLYMFGSLLRGIGVNRERKKIKEQIVNIKNLQSMSRYEIIEQLMEEKVVVSKL